MHHVVHRLVVQAAMMVEGLLTLSSKNVVLKPGAARAHIAVQVASTIGERLAVLQPVVEHSRVSVAVRVEVVFTHTVTAEIGGYVHSAEVTENIPTIVVDVIVVNIEYVVPIVVCTMLHRSSDPLIKNVL